MEFGLFQNGFRRHTTAAQCYDEDLAEIVLADPAVAGVGSSIGQSSYNPSSNRGQFFINLKDNGFLNHTGKTPPGWGYDDLYTV